MSLQVTSLYQRSIYCSHDLYLCLRLIHSAPLPLPISAATVRLDRTCAVDRPENSCLQSLICFRRRRLSPSFHHYKWIASTKPSGHLLLVLLSEVRSEVKKASGEGLVSYSTGTSRTIFASPPIYGRRAVGIRTLPSFC
jgi:hypothetical protein